MKDFDQQCDDKLQDQISSYSNSLVPQLWNPKHIIGFEEFKNFNHNFELADFSVNLNEELDEIATKSAKHFQKEIFPIESNINSNPATPAQQNSEIQMDNQITGYNAAQTGNTFATNCQPATFHAEELTPLNMSRKAKKIFVPEEQKDDRYWNRRMKNNAAAKRSREARHQKENQIRMRALLLEEENMELRSQLLESRKELHRLKEILTKKEGANYPKNAPRRQ